MYQKQCTSCHGDALDGVGPYPPLSGGDFLSKYEGQPVLNVYNLIQKLMPATAPGSLTPPQAADLLAYILSFNKFPAGKTDLPSDEDSLKKLTLPKPAPKT
jgi:mono/diheme cytochrome c family protein